MLNTSARFREAVYSASPSTRILFQFGDTVLTNEDIHLGTGIRFTEPFNHETDLTIGTCPAAQLETMVVNYKRLLSDFRFGEAAVSLGVMIDTAQADPINANCITYLRYGTPQQIAFEGHIGEPHLTVDGVAPDAQPPFPVHAIVLKDDVLYCISEQGQVWVAQWLDGHTWAQLTGKTWSELENGVWDDVQGVLVPITEIDRWRDLESFRWDDLASRTWASFARFPEINAFMVKKLTRWAKVNRGLSLVGDRFIYEFYPDGTIETYEYAKLGKFLFDTPERRKSDLIYLSALDRMKLFDVPADDFLANLPHPITLGSIFTRLCSFVGVSAATTSFINSSRTFVEPPTRAENITAREVLAWIAEAACATARMTRDGELELAWIGVENINIPPQQIFEVDAAEFEVPQIAKLLVSASDLDIGVSIGEGDNGYHIMDNPYLYGGSEAEIRSYAAPIYSRLIGVAAYTPISLVATANWGIQAGDIIQVTTPEGTYKLPIFCQTISWSGGSARAVYECTGSEARPVRDGGTRRLFEQRRATYELTMTVDGVSSRVTNTEEGLETLAQQTADGFLQTVKKGEVISSINQSAEEVRIKADRISLEGTVTANGNFTIHTDGHVSGQGASFTNGSFSGHVSMGSGSIGGFNLSGGGLVSQTGSLSVNPNGEISFGGHLRIYAAAGGSYIQANNSLDLNAPTIYLGGNQGVMEITDAGVWIWAPLYVNGVPVGG